MRQITVTIPDNLYELTLAYLKKLPEATIVSDEHFELTKELIKLLEERQKAPLESYIPLEEVRKRLKDKYAL